MLFGNDLPTFPGIFQSTAISRSVKNVLCPVLKTKICCQISNTRNVSCEMPTFWEDAGDVVKVEANGCLESDFDQYGDMEAFGVHPDWQRQLSKFASVQDRLREWKPEVMQKIQVFSCLAIKALDIDAIRIDKATQVTVDALASWATHTRACAAKLGKTNFFIPGEVTGGDTFGSLYMYVLDFFFLIAPHPVSQRPWKNPHPASSWFPVSSKCHCNSR
jgi:glycosidase